MAPRQIRVRIVQFQGSEPTVENIDAQGTWLSSKRDTGWRRLVSPPISSSLNCWAAAPDWVMEIAEQSLAKIRESES
jgi:hypothetical protein